MTSSIHAPRRTIMSVLAALAAFVAISMACGSTAHAAKLEIDLATGAEVQDFYLCDAKVGNTYVMGCFNNNGDVLYVADWEHDSMRVAVHWRLADGSRRGLCISTKGPVWIPTQGWVGTRLACNKNMKEGKRIEIRAGRCDGTIHSCKALKHYRNWTAWAATTV